MNTTEETHLLVKAYHPAVRARKITQDLLNSELIFSKVEEGSWEYRGTMFYKDKPRSTKCLVTLKCLKEDLWLLGPFPDEGFWICTESILNCCYVSQQLNSNGEAINIDQLIKSDRLIADGKAAKMISNKVSFGRNIYLARVWSPVKMDWVFGQYCIYNGVLFESWLADLDWFDGGELAPPISPVVNFPTIEMKIFVTSFFNIACDVPIIFGDQDGEFEAICALKNAKGYTWSAEWEDFVEKRLPETAEPKSTIGIDHEQYVVKKHPKVKLNCLSWEQASKNFILKSETPFGPRIEVQITGFYDEEDYEVCVVDPSDFGAKNMMYFLGPYPDEGYWITDHLNDYLKVDND